MPDDTSTWYAYECYNPDCRSKKVGDETGCVLDVRFPLDEDEPMMPCPFCQHPMDFRSRWPADYSGYGSRGDHTKIIGIAGGTASGKSTLAKALVEALGDRVLHITHDRYYKTVSREIANHPDRVLLYNYDHPNALETELLADHLSLLRVGLDVRIPNYDFADSMRSPADTWELVVSKPVIIVEGILIFAVPYLRELFDHLIYVDAPDDIRLLRRFNRDIKYRGQKPTEVIKQYEQAVRPMHEEFVRPNAAHAQLTVDGTRDIDLLATEVIMFCGLTT